MDQDAVGAKSQRISVRFHEIDSRQYPQRQGLIAPVGIKFAGKIRVVLALPAVTSPSSLYLRKSTFDGQQLYRRWPSRYNLLR